MKEAKLEIKAKAKGLDVVTAIVDALELSDFRVAILAQKDGRITYVSPSSLTILGSPKHQIEGTLIWDWIHPNDHQLFSKHQITTSSLGNIAENKAFSVTSIRYRHLRAESSYFYAEGDLTVSKSLIYFQLKHVSSEVKKEQETLILQQLQPRLASVLRQASDAVTIQDLEGRITQWNLGLTQEVKTLLISSQQNAYHLPWLKR